MFDTVFSSDIFTQGILPFVLVFVLIFALLEKSKILGEEKRQINAILSLVIGLILVSFPYPRDIIVQLMPFLAVVAVVLLVFMLLYGFAAGNTNGDPLGKGLKITIGILVGIALIIFLAQITGLLGAAIDFLKGSQSGGSIVVNAVFIIIIVAVIFAVIFGGSDKKD